MNFLPESEIEVILKKIEELEKIVNSQDRKNKKWKNANSIIKMDCRQRSRYRTCIFTFVDEDLIMIPLK